MASILPAHGASAAARRPGMTRIWSAACSSGREATHVHTFTLTGVASVNPNCSRMSGEHPKRIDQELRYTAVVGG
jgi:hypothetical protein